MANTIAYNQVLWDELDRAIAQKSMIGMFQDDTFKNKFIGAKTVMIPDIEMQGLGNYSREDGFVRGAVTLVNTPYTLKMERGRSFQIDSQDVDESGVTDMMAGLMSEFVNTKVIPEMDAYGFSTLATLANDAGQTITGAPESAALKMLMEAIDTAKEASAYDESLVAFVNGATWRAIKADKEIQKHIDVGEFKRGEVTTMVKRFDDVPIFPVVSSRMKSAFEFNDGTTGGQEAGGFKPAMDAKDINLLVLPRKAANLIKKQAQIRNFTPAENLDADAYLSDYRLYYDVLTKKSFKKTIFVNLST